MPFHNWFHYEHRFASFLTTLTLFKSTKWFVQAQSYTDHSSWWKLGDNSEIDLEVGMIPDLASNWGAGLFISRHHLSRKADMETRNWGCDRLRLNISIIIEELSLQINGIQ